LGVTSVKIKGKSHRIKTPVCPALKRLQQTPTGGTASGVNGGESSSKIPALPDKIVMELTPGCNADFLRVQSVAHNPRIRICTDSSSPLSNIIAFLTKKWKPRSIADAETAAEVYQFLSPFIILMYLTFTHILGRVNHAHHSRCQNSGPSRFKYPTQ